MRMHSNIHSFVNLDPLGNHRIFATDEASLSFKKVMPESTYILKEMGGKIRKFVAIWIRFEVIFLFAVNEKKCAKPKGLPHEAYDARNSWERWFRRGGINRICKVGSHILKASYHFFVIYLLALLVFIIWKIIFDFACFHHHHDNYDGGEFT